MDQLPHGSVDMVLCDLPYGTTACKWDSVIPFEPLWEQYRRVCSPTATIVLTCIQPFTTALIASNIEMFKYCWAWRKSKASNFLQAPNMPLKILEDIAVFSRGVIGHASQCDGKRMVYHPQGTRKGVRMAKQSSNKSALRYHRGSQTNHTTGYVCQREGYPTSLLEFKSENGLHPTQKPVALFEYLIRTYTNPGDVVLDCCCGSGTTGVAARNTGRQFIQFELSGEYCEIARRRLAGCEPAEPLFLAMQA